MVHVTHELNACMRGFQDVATCRHKKSGLFTACGIVISLCNLLTFD